MTAVGNSERSEDSPMRRGLKLLLRKLAGRGEKAIRRFPDEEGTEMRMQVGLFSAPSAIRRFPDEEGTEICGNPSRRDLAPGPIRRFPDEEGTEI